MSEWCEVCGFQRSRCTCVRPGTGWGEYTYIPVPEWRGDHWEPWNKATERPMQWPDWMTQERIAALPHPWYMPGERVMFKWSYGQTPVGTICRANLSGGRISVFALDHPALVILQRYSREQIMYTINWNGHGRWVDEKDILRRE